MDGRRRRNRSTIIPPDSRKFPQAKFLLVCFATGLAMALTFAGCHRPGSRLPAAQIHAITRELSAAASASPGAEVHADLLASDLTADSRDNLSITVFAVDAADGAVTTVLLQSLGRVATRRGLTQEAQSESREGIVFTYSRAGRPTHSVHIHFAAAKSGQQSAGNTHGLPRLAIILDDLGTDRAAAEAIFALPYRLTIAVLPNRPHSVDIAQAAVSRGYEVMLHLPMESVRNGNPEIQELRPGMSSRQVATLVSAFLTAVPGAVGVNNHQGSQSTANWALMKELMLVLRDQNLFYIDSRTTTATVAFEAARQADVHSAFRNVPFLDDVADPSAVRKQLVRALRGAKDQGEAIAIGHPHRATLTALREILPQAKTQGIQLVHASELVH